MAAATRVRPPSCPSLTPRVCNPSSRNERQKKRCECYSCTRWYEDSVFKKIVNKVGATSGYKPFNLLRSYYKPQTTGPSLMVMLLGIVCICMYTHYGYKRWASASKRSSVEMPKDLSDSFSLGTFAGVGYEFDSGYSGSVTANVTFYTCDEVQTSTALTETCTALTTQDCSGVSNTGLDAAELATLSTVAMACPGTDESLTSNKDLSTSTYLKAVAVLYGTDADVQTALTAGVRFYVVSRLSTEGTKREKILPHDVYSPRSFDGSSSSSIFVNLGYELYHYKSVFRGTINPLSEAKWIVYRGLRQFSTPLIQSGTSTVAFTAKFELLDTLNGIQEVDFLFIDIFVNLAGFLFFIYIASTPIRFYNRFYYRKERFICGGRCRNPCYGELFGGPVTLSNISYNTYLQNFLTKYFQDDTAGVRNFTRIDRLYQDEDTWILTRELNTSINGNSTTNSGLVGRLQSVLAKMDGSINVQRPEGK